MELPAQLDLSKAQHLWKAPWGPKASSPFNPAARVAREAAHDRVWGQKTRLNQLLTQGTHLTSQTPGEWMAKPRVSPHYYRGWHPWQVLELWQTPYDIKHLKRMGMNICNASSLG